MPMELNEVLREAIMAILVALIGFLTKEVVKFFNNKGLTEIIAQKQYLVDIAVRSIEQIYINEDGPKKLQKAKMTALELLRSNNIEITEAELKNFIEASVNAMNEAKKQLESEQSITETLKSVELKGDNLK